MCSAAIALRPACPQDFDYCAKLYFAGMAQIIRQLNLDIRRQAASFQKQWEPAQVQVITLQGADVGWLQIAQTGDSLFLSQLFVDTPFQRQGVGTEVMRQLIRDASATATPSRLPWPRSIPHSSFIKGWASRSPTRTISSSTCDVNPEPRS